MRFFITLSYDGTRYHGWQIQPNGNSVQEELQKALSTLLRQPIEVVGAGRTDAGVHARMMVAHFEYGPSPQPSPRSAMPLRTPVQKKGEGVVTTEVRALNEESFLSTPSPTGEGWGEGLCYKLNKILPQDIAVQKVEEVDDDMHARFSATSRTYHYFVHLRKDPFERAYSWRIPYKIDFDKMNEAAKVLLGTHDFTSFSKTNTDTKTNICTVTEARWERVMSPDGEPSGTVAIREDGTVAIREDGTVAIREDGTVAIREDGTVAIREDGAGTWRFTITANRFLRNMVRAVVGTLVEVGRGKMSIDDLRRVIEQKDRCKAGESVPGNALFLVDIKY